ncbi:MAG: toxic anion resistance protein [Hungatella sp.]|nr:toxic anion resistance protein [Hungatella sp.]
MEREFDAALDQGPVLTLDPFMDKGLETEQGKEERSVKAEEPEPVQVVLTPKEEKQVEEFAAKIDLNNAGMVLQYGAGAQKKIADFSDSALEHMKTKDLGEIGQMLADVVGELKDLDKEEEKGIFSIFKKGGNRLTGMRAKYEKAQANVNRICKALEGHQVQLLKDIATMDRMYDINLSYLKELSMYILAGKRKLKIAMEQELPAAVEKARRTGLPEDTQEANDLANRCSRFEKKLHDLELTRMVSLQMAPQIRLVQNNDSMMSEKIQSTLVNTIPLWKTQMVLTVGLNHSAEAARAQRQVTDATNELLKKNAHMLKMATVETARESERGIVDMETLKATNQSLISTLDEVMKIQEEGRAKRREAQAELGRLEEELRVKLLEISGKRA